MISHYCRVTLREGCSWTPYQPLKQPGIIAGSGRNGEWNGFHEYGALGLTANRLSATQQRKEKSLS